MSTGCSIAESSPPCRIDTLLFCGLNGWSHQVLWKAVSSFEASWSSHDTITSPPRGSLCTGRDGNHSLLIWGRSKLAWPHWRQPWLTSRAWKDPCEWKRIMFTWKGLKRYPFMRQVARGEAEKLWPEHQQENLGCKIGCNWICLDVCQIGQGEIDRLHDPTLSYRVSTFRDCTKLIQQLTSTRHVGSDQVNRWLVRSDSETETKNVVGWAKTKRWVFNSVDTSAGAEASLSHGWPGFEYFEWDRFQLQWLQQLKYTYMISSNI